MSVEPREHIEWCRQPLEPCSCPQPTEAELRALVDQLVVERDHYRRFAMMVGEIVRLIPEDVPSIDVEVLLRDLPAHVAAIRDERDRLKTVVWGETKLRAALAGARSAREQLREERYQMQAVVNAVRDAFVRPNENEWKINHGALVVLATALDAYDAGKEVNDG